jgi:REP element-mobilizing transposase RayT
MHVEMAGHGAPRLASYTYRGLAAYSVTSCTFGRLPVFTDGRWAVEVSRQLLQQAVCHRFDVSAYCFMPNHVHALFEAIAIGSDFRRLMNRWKQESGYAYRRATGLRLWQSGYYDHVLRQDEDRLRVMAYLLGNPLRAGLVTDICDYPFWGSAVWSRNELIDAVRDLVPVERTL